jgi:integrase
LIALFDAIEDGSGPRMADQVLQQLRQAFEWHAGRDEDFASPCTGIARRTKPSELARARILDDQEIRELRRALDELEVELPVYCRLTWFLLLSTCRRAEAAGMHTREVSGDVWVIPAGRYKSGKDHELSLTPALRELLGEGSSFLFSNNGGKAPFTAFSRPKRMLDAKIAEIRKCDGREPMPGWRLHDLRRTARSLMSRAGVPSDVAERVLGHSLQGVRGVYDRHAYSIEKRDALERLAALIERILAPPSEVEVIPFIKGGAAR